MPLPLFSPIWCRHWVTYVTMHLVVVLNCLHVYTRWLVQKLPNFVASIKTTGVPPQFLQCPDAVHVCLCVEIEIWKTFFLSSCPQDWQKKIVRINFDPCLLAYVESFPRILMVLQTLLSSMALLDPLPVLCPALVCPWMWVVASLVSWFYARVSRVLLSTRFLHRSWGSVRQSVRSLRSLSLLDTHGQCVIQLAVG